MTAVWTVEFKRGGKWVFSAAYPTLKEARAWVVYMQPELHKRVRKWVRPDTDRSLCSKGKLG